MGFLNKLFSVDPRKEIAKAERWLDDTPERAFEHLQGVLAKVPEEHHGLVNQALERARTAVIERALKHAAASENDGFFEDAADWLESAIAHTRDENQRQKWRAKQDEFEMGLFSMRQQERLRAEAAANEASRVDEADIDRGPEDLFDTAIDMFRDEVAERYRAQGETFRQLFLQMHDGKLDGLEEGLSRILATADAGSDTHAVVTLERGKLRLLQKNFQEAKADFEACWQAWGDDPLDWHGSHSLPSLWAEAALGVGDSEAVLDPLHDLADPGLRRIDIILPYSEALSLHHETDGAMTYLRHVVRIFPEYEELSHFYAIALQNSGQPEEAIACLEEAMTSSQEADPSRVPTMPLPALRMLLALYLHKPSPDARDDVAEVADLMRRHGHHQLSNEDHQLLSKAHDLYGSKADAELHLEWARQAEAMDVGLDAADTEVGLEGVPESTP